MLTLRLKLPNGDALDLPLLEVEAAGEVTLELRCCEYDGRLFQVYPHNPDQKFCSKNCCDYFNRNQRILEF